MSKSRPSQDGALLIAEERERQKAVEGWTPGHDDNHIDGELRDAAIAYAMVCDDRAGEYAKDIYPWPDAWKPNDDPIRNLVRAGALIAAEIDRVQRMG